MVTQRQARVASAHWLVSIWPWCVHVQIHQWGMRAGPDAHCAPMYEVNAVLTSRMQITLSEAWCPAFADILGRQISKITAEFKMQPTCSDYLKGCNAL
jgi:hypothetical protein